MSETPGSPRGEGEMTEAKAELANEHELSERLRDLRGRYQELRGRL